MFKIPEPFPEPPHVYCDPIDEIFDKIAIACLLAMLLALAFCAGFCAAYYFV